MSGVDGQSHQVPHLLPASIADFTGREAQITQIKHLPTEDQHPYAVRIVAICGKAGVGKSSLAVRVAHQFREAFPDGHLYADMDSRTGDNHTPRLLGRFLRALGVDGSSIPEGLIERAEMYRSRLANKRILVLLDEVVAEEQVLPMPPGSPTCAVIVTCRSRLGGLSGGTVWMSVSSTWTSGSSCWSGSSVNSGYGQIGRRRSGWSTCAAGYRWRCGSPGPGWRPGRTGGSAGWCGDGPTSRGGWTRSPTTGWHCVRASIWPTGDWAGRRSA
ncbi:NB-ARC domain-containing protein [Streptomyces shenzhenensis]|uniref:NB-ARC domain-containing protein n=1 Tax=Streptomyces shenzhenensis TaxID=943815 RepID=UPI003830DEDD